MDFSSFKTSGTSAVGSLLTITRASIALGFGLLVAGKLKDKSRQKVAIALLSLGVASALPYVVELVVRQINDPESSRSVNRQLRSIREDSGMEAGYEVV